MYGDLFMRLELWVIKNLLCKSSMFFIACYIWYYYYIYGLSASRSLSHFSNEIHDDGRTV